MNTLSTHSAHHLFAAGIVFLIFCSLPALGQSTVSVGGHAGISIVDGTYGSSSDGLGSSDTSADYAGFKFLKFIMFVRYALTDRLTIDVRPQIETRGVDGTTGASPKFGKNIGEQRATRTSVQFNGFTRAVASYVLPSTTELSIGYLNTRFTWEYGNELFWEDEMNGSPFALSPKLGNFTDVGIEALHYFDFGMSSLPVYFYLLNGSGDEEINQTPVGMVAAEPQIGPIRFHVALAGGAWDEENEKAMARGSIGMTLSHKKFQIRMEEAAGYWQENITGSPDDAMPHGGYIKFIYGISSHLRATLNLSYAYNNFVNIYNPQPGEEVYLTITPSLQIITSPSSRIILQSDLCSWKQNPTEGISGEKELRYIRGNIGWRLTF